VIRIAWFVDSMQVGGTELNAVRVLEGLDRSRFDVSVYHMGGEGSILARYERLGCPLHHIPLQGFLRPSTLLTGLRVARLLRAARTQIVQSHDIYSNVMAAPWARLARVPVVVASRRWDRAVPGAALARVNALAERSATSVIANSAAVARLLIEEDGVADRRVAIIPNGVGTEAFLPYPPEERAALLEAMGIPSGALVVGMVARLSAVKDHESLLKALAILVRGNPMVFGLFVGEGPMRGTIEQCVIDLGLMGRVALAGELSNTPNPHQLFDISVLSSVTEGFPNSVVEAMAAGRPVVATAVGGTPEAVVEGVTGLLVPPKDPEAMAAAIQRLIDSPAERVSLGIAGRARAAEEYGWQRVMTQWSEFYSSLVLGLTP